MSGGRADGIRISGDLGRHLVRLRDETLAWICAELIIDPEPVRVLQLRSPDMVDAHGDPDPDGTAGLYARPMTALDRLVDAFVVHLQTIWPEGVDAVARTICENYLLRACGHRRYLPRSNGAAVLMVSAALRHGDDQSVAVEDGGGVPFGDGLLAEHAASTLPSSQAIKQYGEALGKVVGDELAAGAQAPGLDDPAPDIARKGYEHRSLEWRRHAKRIRDWGKGAFVDPAALGMVISVVKFVQGNEWDQPGSPPQNVIVVGECRSGKSVLGTMLVSVTGGECRDDKHGQVFDLRTRRRSVRLYEQNRFDPDVLPARELILVIQMQHVPWLDGIAKSIAYLGASVAFDVLERVAAKRAGAGA